MKVLCKLGFHKKSEEAYRVGYGYVDCMCDRCGKYVTLWSAWG